MPWPSSRRPRALGAALVVLWAATFELASACDPIGTVVPIEDGAPETLYEPDGAPVPFDTGPAPDAGIDSALPDAPLPGADADADAAPPDAPMESASDAALDTPADTRVPSDTSAPADAVPPPDTASPDSGAPLDSSAPVADSAAPDATLAPDTAPVLDATTPSDSTVPQEATVPNDTGTPTDATLRDSAVVDAAAADAGTITCTTTRRVLTSNGCVGAVTVEANVGLFPVAWPGLGWAGALGTNSSGISELYTNNPVANPSQQFLFATDETLALYVGYTDTPGDGGPGDWGTAHRTDNLITSFTLNVTKLGSPPPGCTVPELSVVCSGSTTLGCEWYGEACTGAVACCPDSIFTTPGDAGPFTVACTQQTCCNPAGAACNTGVACCSGTCTADGGPGVCE